MEVMFIFIFQKPVCVLQIIFEIEQIKPESWNMAIGFKYFILASLWRIKSFDAFDDMEMEKYHLSVLFGKGKQRLILWLYLHWQCTGCLFTINILLLTA